MPGSFPADPIQKGKALGTRLGAKSIQGVTALEHPTSVRTAVGSNTICELRKFCSEFSLYTYDSLYLSSNAHLHLNGFHFCPAIRLISLNRSSTLSKGSNLNWFKLLSTGNNNNRTPLRRCKLNYK